MNIKDVKPVLQKLISELQEALPDNKAVAARVSHVLTECRKVTTAEISRLRTENETLRKQTDGTIQRELDKANKEIKQLREEANAGYDVIDEMCDEWEKGKKGLQDKAEKLDIISTVLRHPVRIIYGVGCEKMSDDVILDSLIAFVNALQNGAAYDYKCGKYFIWWHDYEYELIGIIGRTRTFFMTERITDATIKALHDRPDPFLTIYKGEPVAIRGDKVVPLEEMERRAWKASTTA